jgi:N-acetylmuramoyl-L-alanine amidase
MITLSAGHYGKGTGAVDLMDEGSEVQAVVEQLAKRLMVKHIQTNVIIDRVSKSQKQNLTYLVHQHNQTNRQLDVSIHFNASKERTEAGIGTEVLYVNPALQLLAENMSKAIATAGSFKNRGAKKRTDLAILNKTTAPAILIELCFVNSTEDVLLYRTHQSKIFDAIVQVLEDSIQPFSLPFSQPALKQRVEMIFANKELVRKQLQQGIEEGAFQQVWLEKFTNGELTLLDYLGCTLLQFYKRNDK